MDEKKEVTWLILYQQCCTLSFPRTVEEEMAQRWHFGAILDETEENEEGANRREKPTQGFYVQGRSL